MTEIREKVKNELTKILKRKIKPKDILNIEISIYNSTINYCKNNNIPCNWESELFSDTYIQKTISIYSNLKEHSIHLIDDIKSKKIKAENLSFMKPTELNENIWKDLLDKYKDKLKNAYEVKMVSMSDHIVCRKCKSREIVYYEFQCRKADEGSSTAYTCLNCNFKWKKN